MSRFTNTTADPSLSCLNGTTLLAEYLMSF